MYRLAAAWGQVRAECIDWPETALSEGSAALQWVLTIIVGAVRESHSSRASRASMLRLDERFLMETSDPWLRGGPLSESCSLPAPRAGDLKRMGRVPWERRVRLYPCRPVGGLSQAQQPCGQLTSREPIARANSLPPYLFPRVMSPCVYRATTIRWIGGGHREGGEGGQGRDARARGGNNTLMCTFSKKKKIKIN